MTSTLADRAIALMSSDALYGNSLVSGVVGNLRRARRFVFDAGASARLGELMRDVPAEILRQHAFARQPFEEMWVETDTAAYYRAVNHREPDGETTTGYLFQGGDVMTISGGRTETPMVWPITCHLHRAWGTGQRDQFKRYLTLTERELEIFALGRAYNDVEPTLREEVVAAHSFGLLIPDRYKTPDRVPELFFKSCLAEQTGELKKIISILLLLTRPGVAQVSGETARRMGFIKGKLRPYLSHRVVTIPLDPRPIFRSQPGPPTGIERRRHDVRGHWCQDRTAREYATIAGCEHRWVPAAPGAFGQGENERFTCALCGGRRWWRRECTRGSAGEGFVVRDGYEVTTTRGEKRCLSTD